MYKWCKKIQCTNNKGNALNTDDKILTADIFKRMEWVERHGRIRLRKEDELDKYARKWSGKKCKEVKWMKRHNEAFTDISSNWTENASMYQRHTQDQTHSTTKSGLVRTLWVMVERTFVWPLSSTCCTISHLPEIRPPQGAFSDPWALAQSIPDEKNQPISNFIRISVA